MESTYLYPSHPRPDRRPTWYARKYRFEDTAGIEELGKDEDLGKLEGYLRRILVLDPKKRPEASELLGDSWVNEGEGDERSKAGIEVYNQWLQRRD